jgi:arabinogalactan oligomer / maltooligosaccharide transport system permease protein
MLNVGNTVPPEGTRGVVVALGTVLLICAAALAGGFAVFSGILNALPTSEIPGWVLLISTLILLVPIMLFAIRVFPWLSNWYYLLPAIVFVLVFTVYPIMLTVFYAFTNFSAQNSGRPDSSTEIRIERVSATELKILEGTLTDLRCTNPDCVGQIIELRTNGDVPRPGPNSIIQSVSGTSITLQSPVPESFVPTLIRKINPYSFVGLENFQFILKNASVQLLPVFLWTVIFATSTTALNMVLGTLLGILLNNKRLKFRNVYRSILILPWAMPTVISILMWQKLFNTQFGALNRLAGLFEIPPAPWLTDIYWAKIAVLLVNLWLGFPYMMTVALAALSTIPDELYEAASIDGATKFEQVRHITLPNLREAFIPVALGTFAFNFNNFGIIYLLMPDNLGPIESGMLPTAHGADILLSWGFKTAFTGAGGQAYGLGGAITIIIGLLTFAISFVNFKAAGIFDEARK